MYDAVAADPQRFGPRAEALVREARRARHPEALVLALRAQAWADRARLADVTARRLLDEAARIARRHRLDHGLADVLMSRAAVNQELGHLAAAQHDLDAAAPLLAADRRIELTFQQAVLHQNIGRLTPAAAAYQDLLARPRVPPRTRTVAANNLALIEAQHGRYVEAIRRLDDAAERAAAVGPAVVALVAQSRAWVTVQSGRLAEGLRLFEYAARAHQQANLPMGEHYTDYADALMDLRLIPEASSVARSAAEEFRTSGVPLMGAETQLRIAQLALLSGNAAEAEAAATAAIDSFGRQGRGAWKQRAVLVKAEARLHAGTATAGDLRAVRRAARVFDSLGTSTTAVQAYLVLGRIAALLGRTREAVPALRRAADLGLSSPILVRLRGRVAAALAARLLDRDGEALINCGRGLTDLARHRTALPSVELRALASGHGAELGQIGLEVVVRGGPPRRVLDWMERTRAAALVAVEPANPAPVSDDFQALRAVHAELEGQSQRADHRAGDSPTLLVERRTIEQRIRGATWRGEAAGGNRRRTAATPPLRDALDGRVLLEYGIVGDELVAVVVGRHRGRVVALGPVGAAVQQLPALQFALRRLSQNRPPATLAAARQSADLRLDRLRGLLLSPLALPEDAELVVVPVGPLYGVPWSALHPGPLSLAPSARFWARTRRAAQERGGRDDATVALIEGPHLPGATAEVRALHEVYPHATVLRPPDGTAEAVARTLAGADLAHLACHGRLRSDNPMFSSLVLSDGPLTLQEMDTRGIAPHRLVIASCESGVHVNYAGDEVLGFVSALLARGTAGIVASTQAFPDLAAVTLMRRLHEHLATGRTFAHALHAARASLDRDEPGMYVNWCTFSAYGAA